MALIKFKKNIKDYNYFLAFDLASHITGWSLIKVDWGDMMLDERLLIKRKNDTKEVSVTSNGNHFELITSGIIDSKNFNLEKGYYKELYDNIYEIISKCILCVEKLSDGNAKLLITKEACPAQAGQFTTIATLQSLSKAHAILDLVIQTIGADCYDENGVHTISVKALFNDLCDLSTCTKEDIRSYLSRFVTTTLKPDADLNISDSIGVSVTLISKKWNSDIKSEITDLKREQKKYKTDKKKQDIQSKIDKITDMMI